ncbi:MAG: thiamine pyrophosphate-binding protein [Chloroflexota bacterium]|jgi:acetolactate synthase-1/2/3 large subunit
MRVNTTAQLFAETIRGHGITHLFMVPAVFHTAMAAMEELGIRRVTTHHEVAAAYMADGYARASRKPGICMAQSVGAANVAAGLRDAFLSGSPVIAVTGGPHPDSRYRYLYQVIEDFPMFEPVTKFNARVDKPSRLADLLRQAFRVATTGSPGPVHLELPGRLGEGVNGEGDFEVIVEKQHSRYPAYRLEPEAEAVRQAASALVAAERPVIVAGGGVVASEAGAELVKLAEMLAIPVATSPTGKGSIPEDHPLAIGLVGSYGRWSANRIVEQADLVFFVGSRTGGLTTRNWATPPAGTPVIQLDIEPSEIGRNYPVQVGLLGDARVTLRRLMAEIQPLGKHSSAWAERAQGLLSQWRSEMAPLLGSDAVPIRPERLCREITDFLPEEGVVVADTGHAAIWSGTMIELKRPGQRFIRCAGTLGWSFPASLGVKCALPDKPVLCFTGDGGFYYHMGELETAARFGINTVVVVNNNGALQQVKKGFDRAYGGEQRGRAHEMWVFEEQNLATVARDMGWLGIRVERPEQIGPALEEAFAAGKPALLDVVTDLEAQPQWW